MQSIAKRYKKLSHEDTVELIKENTKESLRMAVLGNMRLVLKIIRKYYGSAVSYTVDEDDLVQSGTLGLIKAVRDFDATRGVRFSTCAWTYIRREIVHFLKKDRLIRTKKDVAYVFLDDEVENREGRSVSIIDLMEEKEDDHSTLELWESIKAEMEYLGEEEREMLLEKARGARAEDMAERYGYSLRTIYNRIDSAREQLAERIPVGV